MRAPFGSRLTVVVSMFLLLGATTPEARAPTEVDSAVAQKVRATARINGCSEKGIRGAAVLREEGTAEGVKLVTVRIKMRGLPPGQHAVHIHETASCDPCSAAGGHFDPGPESNSSPDGNHPFHLGDLINIDIRGSGRGGLTAQTSRVTLSPGPLSIFEPDGTPSSAFIIHVDPDTYCPDGVAAGCAGGARAACGIIKLDR